MRAGTRCGVMPRAVGRKGKLDGWSSGGKSVEKLVVVRWLDMVLVVVGVVCFLYWGWWQLGAVCFGSWLGSVTLRVVKIL